MNRRYKFSSLVFVAVNILYMLNICGILLTVVLMSFSKNWFTGLFPKEFTTEWYTYVSQNHDLPNLIKVTVIVVVITLAASLLIAFPAAYIMARNEFRFKNIIMMLFLLPVIIPPMTYGLPLATVLYKVRLAPHLSGVIIANMVPTVAFMILVLVPFIEQIGSNLESAARMLGANKMKIFTRILVPLSMPGILSAGVLSLVRVISMLELSFLVAGGKTQTLVVAVFADAYCPGSRPLQAIDALAVLFFIITLACFTLSLKFVKPTQMVVNIK